MIDTLGLDRYIEDYSTSQGDSTSKEDGSTVSNEWW